MPVRRLPGSPVCRLQIISIAGSKPIMNSDLVITEEAPGTWSGLDLESVRTLRLATATTLSVAISYGFPWPLSYITPVFVWAFLKTPTSGLTFQGGIHTIFAMIFGCAFGFVLSLTLLNYPVVFSLVMALVLFFIYYANAGGASPVMVMFTTMGVTVIPMVALSSKETALIVVLALILNCTVAVVVSWFTQSLIREPHDLNTVQPAGDPKKEVPQRTKLINAALSTIAVTPVVVLFFAFNVSGQIIVMVFIAILAQQASSDIGRKMTKAMIVGNTLGGVAAVVFYYLLVAAPSFGFLLGLTLLSSLFFARINFAGRKASPLFAMGFSTLLILIGGSTAPYADEAGVDFLVRVGQIMTAGFYICVAFRMLESIQAWRGGNHEQR